MSRPRATFSIRAGAGMRVPGQVPGYHEYAQLSRPPSPWTEAQYYAEEPPVLTSWKVPRELGLPASEERKIASFVRKSAKSSANELAFRLELMKSFTESYPPLMRRKLLQRALSYYRHTAPAPQQFQDYRRTFVPQHSVTGRSLAPPLCKSYGGRYFAKTTGADGRTKYAYRRAAAELGEGMKVKLQRVEQKLRELQKAGRLTPAKLKPLVAKYSLPLVTQAMKALGLTASLSKAAAPPARPAIPAQPANMRSDAPAQRPARPQRPAMARSMAAPKMRLTYRPSSENLLWKSLTTRESK